LVLYRIERKLDTSLVDVAAILRTRIFEKRLRDHELPRVAVPALLESLDGPPLAT
jgi:hypothetical protein